MKIRVYGKAYKFEIRKKLNKMRLGYEHDATEIKQNDNLIVKGNNLLALASLKKKFSGKIKLICMTRHIIQEMIVLGIMIDLTIPHG